MQILAHRFVLSLLFPAVLAACSQSPGEIKRDTEPFDGIAPQAEITVLGNEPFWGLSIKPQGDSYTATYSNPENIEGTVFPATRFAGNNGIGFSGEMEGKAVQLALTPGACSDTMSDRSYPYTATLSIGDETLFGCAYTSDEPFTGDEAP